MLDINRIEKTLANKVIKLFDENLEQIVLQFGNLVTDDSKFSMFDQRISFKVWTDLQNACLCDARFLGRQDFKVYMYANMQLKIKKFTKISRKVSRISSRCLDQFTSDDGNVIVRCVEKKEKEMPIHTFENRREYPYEVDEIVYVYGTSDDKIKIKFYQIDKDGSNTYHYELEVRNDVDPKSLIKILDVFR